MVKRVVCREYHSCKTVNEADGKKKQTTKNNYTCPETCSNQHVK